MKVDGKETKSFKEDASVHVTLKAEYDVNVVAGWVASISEKLTCFEKHRTMAVDGEQLEYDFKKDARDCPTKRADLTFLLQFGVGISD